MTDKTPALCDDPVYGHAVREAARVNKLGGLTKNEKVIDVNAICIAIDRMANEIVKLRNTSAAPILEFTRDMAIQRLKLWGHIDATKRTWSMGETIVVPLGPPMTHENGIKSYAGCIYIYPEDDRDRLSRWGITDCGNMNRFYDSLAKAIDGAHEYIEFITPYIRTQY